MSDGGLDASTAVCSVDPSSGTPLFTDGPYVETKEHLGGFTVVDVPGDAEARYWAGRIAVAVGWPQEVHRFPHAIALSADTQSDALGPPLVAAHRGLAGRLSWAALHSSRSARTQIQCVAARHVIGRSSRPVTYL